MVLDIKTKYSDIAKQVDNLNKKSKNVRFKNDTASKKKNKGDKKKNQSREQKKKEKERLRKEREAEMGKIKKEKEKARQEKLELKRKAKEEKIKERERKKAEREKEKAKALEMKRKAKEEKRKEKERLAKEKEEKLRKEKEAREKERQKQLEMQRQAKEAEIKEREKKKQELEQEKLRQLELKKKAQEAELKKREKIEQERIKEQERLDRERKKQLKKIEEEKLRQAELERQAQEQKKKEKERLRKEREAEMGKIKKEKEKARQEKLELKRKAKEEKIKERERKKAEREKEKAKALEMKRKAKEEKRKEKERLAKEKEEKLRKEKEAREKERQKQLEMQRQAKEAEIKEREKIATQHEDKIRQEPEQKFDQSRIEVVKNIDYEVINLKDESELSKVVKEIHEGDIIYERTGFGWKGLGSRRIVLDETLKQYVYEVLEPKLTPEEEKIKKRLIHLFRTRADVDVSSVYDKLREEILEKTLDDLREKYRIDLDEKSKNKIYYYIYQDFVGYGKIDIPMHDEGIEDISCDGCNIPIFLYHKQFESIRTNIVFTTPEELDSFVIKLSQMCGKQISVYEPVVDGKLEDGSRLQVTLGKTITKYSTFTIRRFREDPLTPVDLVANNTMDINMAAYFWLVIEKGASVLFCGGTASGKTTMLNALSMFLPTSYKIVSVEDTREINLPHENWIAGTTRTGFSSSEASKTGKDIDMFDLIRVALRQRPKAIIVGEVRGKEAYTLFQAMTTGHLSYSTVHASDMHSLIQRLESPPINLPRSLLTSLDMVVFLNNLTVNGNPVRRITNITEIIKLDPDTNRLVTVSPFYWVSEVEDRFENTGGSKILNKIKLENMWTDEKLEEDLEKRKKVLKWMMENKLRSYVQVGNIISEYYNDPKNLLKKIEDSK